MKVSGYYMKKDMILFFRGKTEKFIWEENSEGLLNPVNYNPFIGLGGRV